MIRTGLRRWVKLGMIGLPWLGLACSPLSQNNPPTPQPLTPAPNMMFAPSADSDFKFRLASAPVANEPPPALPINLDSVLRLAGEKNPQISLALSKVWAAYTDKDLTASRWFPDVYLGVGYFRHDGGIQLQEGPIIDSNTQAMLAGLQADITYDPKDYAFRQLTAARKVWQENGDLAKITFEQTLDAATTYIDLLAAHTTLCISLDLEKDLRALQPKAKSAAEHIGTVQYKIQEQRLQSEINTQLQNQQKLHGKIEAAMARLAYLLGLDMNVCLLPADPQLVAFHIVDVGQPVEALVAQSLTNGPGVHELQGILCVIQDGMKQAKGPIRFVPQFQVQAGEGLFGAGISGTMGFDNRFDVGVQARWNVSDFLRSERKRQVALAQMNTAAWTYQDLRAKLTLGVQEAKATIDSNCSQFILAEQQIRDQRQMAESVEKANVEAPQDVPLNQVMLAYMAVAQAQLNYVELLRDFDKAQLRLMILLGPGMKAAAMPCPEPVPPVPVEKQPAGEKLPTPRNETRAPSAVPAIVANSQPTAGLVK